MNTSTVGGSVDLSKNTDNTKSNTPYAPFFKLYLKERKKSLLAKQSDSQSTVQVSEVLGKIAYLYERIRNAIEYKGEYVLRRNAIERILKRLIWERLRHDTKKMSKVLIRELIWARYLPNDAVSRNKLAEVAHIIDKYLYFLDELKHKGGTIPFQEVREWVWGIASCEIEETIDPSNREPFVVMMYQWFNTYFKWESTTISEHERSIQIYLNIHRSLTKSDNEIMRYNLLIREFPNWIQADKKTVDEAVERFSHLYEEIEKHLNFPLRNTIYRKIQKESAPFEVVKELLDTYPNQYKYIFEDKLDLEHKIKNICDVKYKDIGKKINLGILRSVTYIFVTKIIFAVLIEVPYDWVFLGHIAYIPLSINIIIPPFLMYLLGFTINPPGESNTRRIIKKAKTIVYENNSTMVTTFTIGGARRNSLMTTIFSGIYLVLTFLIFSAITAILLALDFTVLGILIFFAFLSLVLLFGFRVRYTAMELRVTGEKEGIIEHLFNNITLPFLNTGVILSKGLAKINIFTAILDFLIEAPLKTIIEVFEEWTSFIREKKEEVVEVPQE